MSRLTQPINQVRLTNVAVVKLKTHGKRYEVACYRNKAMNWRAGIETDIDEVLQTSKIFINVSKGQIAKNNDLLHAFKTTDEETIARIILQKGELQVSDRERETLLNGLYKDVCSIVASKCFSLRSGLPMTVNMVESALKDLGFSVKWGESAKKLSLRAIELLRKEMPDEVARVKMTLRICCDVRFKEKLYLFLQDKCDATFDSTDILKCDAHSTDILKVDGENKDSKKSSSPNVLETSVSPTVSHLVAQFSCDPVHYRQIDQFVNEELTPSGTLLLITSRGDLDDQRIHRTVKPDEVGGVMKGRNASTDEKQTVVSSFMTQTSDCGYVEKPANEGYSSGRVVSGLTEGNLKCSTCNVDFPTAEYRSHCTTAWHCFNTKRKFKNLDPINESGFRELNDDAHMHFLAVDS